MVDGAGARAALAPAAPGLGAVGAPVGVGLVDGSNTTDGLPRKCVATEAQNRGELSRLAMGLLSVTTVRGVPVQVEDRHHAVGVDARDVVRDRPPVLLPAALRRDAGVDVQPAVLVQRHADGGGAPVPDARQHRRAAHLGLGVEEAPALGAGVLGAGVVDAEQPDGAAVAVDDPAGADGAQVTGGRR